MFGATITSSSSGSFIAVSMRNTYVIPFYIEVLKRMQNKCMDIVTRISRLYKFDFYTFAKLIFIVVFSIIRYKG